MKKYYVIMGSTKDDNKYPIVFEGWFRTKKDALASAKRQEKIPVNMLYGASFDLWEFINHYILRKKDTKVGILVKDLK